MRTAKYLAPSSAGLDLEVRRERFTCQRCTGTFEHPMLYAMEPNPDDPDGEPVPRMWGGDVAAPPHCPPCTAALVEEAQRRQEGILRAERMDVSNPVYRKRLEAAGIRHPRLLRATLKNFDQSVPAGLSVDALKAAQRAALAAEEAYRAARSFVEGVLSGDLGDRPWRFFSGPTGTGKTHLMVGMDRALFGMGYPGKVALIVAPLFVENVQLGYGNKTATSLLASVRDADVVFVDDLGRGRQYDDRAGIMNELGCQLEGKPVVWSSNFTREGLVERNAEFMTLASRLGPASCWTVELLDRDRRDDAPQEDQWTKAKTRPAA